MIAAPIMVQGMVLGVASFYRFGNADPFDEDDIQLAGDLASRAAVCLDNARRFERERAMALALQRSLLPRAFPAQCAVEVAHRYQPAQEGVGGDWYDVIPLSGGRVALVVGDVVGHGIHAAATMGRLRTAVRNFCALDLPAEDLLSQLDALVESMDADEAEDQRGVGIIGATCLYVVYDPVTGLCSVAAAGHPSPAVVARDGSVRYLDLPTGPPLGLGGSAYEAIELPIDEGSTLVLYTDGLVESREQDIGTGLERLEAALAGAGRDPEELCASAIGGLLPERPSDDVALLAARARRTTAGPRRHLGRADDAGVGGVPARRGVAPAAGLAPGRSGLHHRARRQRTGDERDPARHRPGRAAAAARPGPDLRSGRRQQRLAPPAPRADLRRRRTRPVPRGAAVATLGNAVHRTRQGDLVRAAAAGERRLLAESWRPGEN